MQTPMEQQSFPVFQPPTPPPVPKDRSFTPWLIGCGVLFFVFLLAMVVLSVFFIAKGGGTLRSAAIEKGTSSDVSKIKMANELGPAELKFIQDKKLLGPGEKLITYYDLWMDQSEVSLLTTQRVVYYTEGHVTSIPLKEIKEVKRYRQNDGGDGIETFVIVSNTNEHMKVEFNAYEGADVFERELNDARKQLSAPAKADSGTNKAPAHVKAGATKPAGH
jgi:hypothetical protein